ncbi:MAG: helix-turn-helix domain-containing protein, partial [Leucobacter sp.]|nr:helix-turn-helix domain-containing protein [Leucobacter sp.]
MSEPSHVQSVTRAFELLEALAAAETSLALADLAQRA